MKKSNFLYMLFAIFISVSLISCEELVSETCDSEDFGEDICPADVSVIATFCTDGVSNSYYTYGGDTYECTGVDASTCDDALLAIGIKIIEDNPTCSTKKSGELASVDYKLTQLAESLLSEVRAKSLCN